jgi:hypothetical protein
MKKVKKSEKVPAFLQSALWSYDIKKFNPRDRADKKIIIEQVLNYGTWKQLEWVVNFYSWREIKEVVKNPSRGIWFEQSLNYWTQFFGIKRQSKKYERAIFRIIPDFNNMAMYVPGNS